MVRVDRHRSALGEWEMLTRRTPQLRVCAYEQRTARPLCRREIPGIAVSVIVNLGPPLRVDGVPHGSFVTGPYDAPALVADDGVQAGVQIELSPLDARRAFGVPMRELAGASLEIGELWDPLLAERLAALPDGRSRLEAAERLVRDRLAVAAPAPRELRWALGRVGTTPVAALARELGWSHRRLLGEFREHVGLAPKTVARILRFRRAVERLREGEDLAGVAYECGYYDQAHFNRDFRDFAHTTPTAFLAARLPDGGGDSVQDGPEAAA